MGIIMHPVVAPADARKVSAPAFQTLVTAILSTGRGDDDHHPTWVEAPLAVFTGKPAENLIVWDLGSEGVPQGAAWAGDDLDELAAALKKAFAKKTEVAVWFSAINESCRVVGRIAGDGYVRGAFRWRPKAKLIAISNAYDDGEWPSVKATASFELEGKSAPFAEEILKTPIGTALVKVFGKKPFAETSMY